MSILTWHQRHFGSGDALMHDVAVGQLAYLPIQVLLLHLHNSKPKSSVQHI
jgi:hypothetical protein